MSYRSIGADLTWYGSTNTTAPASMQRKATPGAWERASGHFLTGLEIAGKVAGAGQQAAPPPRSNMTMYLALGGGALLLVVLLAGKK